MLEAKIERGCVMFDYLIKKYQRQLTQKEVMKECQINEKEFFRFFGRDKKITILKVVTYINLIEAKL